MPNKPKDGRCRICRSLEHGYTKCPVPIEAPRVPQRDGESLESYHVRLRENAWKRVAEAEKYRNSPASARRKFRERYSKDPLPFRKGQQARYNKHRAMVDQLKSGPCLDCGGRFPPECMDFDHRPGETKLAGVGMMQCNSWDRIKAEVAKCDLVCANCHRIRTRRRLLGTQDLAKGNIK